MSSQQLAKTSNSLSFPSEATLLKAFKLSLKLTKPLDTYFYVDSYRNNVCIMNDGEEMIIYKNDDEHTSPILKVFNSENNYIVVTTNTIYILNGDTEIKNVEDDGTEA